MELIEVSTFVLNAEKVGIVGVLLIVIVYFAYIQNTTLKRITEAVDSLRETCKSVIQGSLSRLERVDLKLNNIMDELKDIKRDINK